MLPSVCLTTVDKLLDRPQHDWNHGGKQYFHYVVSDFHDASDGRVA